jgi:hypothetical protein
MSTTNNDRSVKLNFTQLREFHDVVNIALNRDTEYDTQVRLSDGTDVVLDKLHCNIKGDLDGTATKATKADEITLTDGTLRDITCNITGNAATATAAIGPLASELNVKPNIQYQVQHISTNQLGGDGDMNGGNVSIGSGAHVSMSSDGTRVAVGLNYDPELVDLVGGVRVYEYTNGSWNQLGQDVAGFDTRSHPLRSVSLSRDGNILAVGVPSSPIVNPGAGKVYVFEWKPDESTWSPLGKTTYIGGSAITLGVIEGIFDGVDDVNFGDIVRWVSNPLDIDGTGEYIAISGSGDGSGIVRFYRYDSQPLIDSWYSVGFLTGKTGDVKISSLDLSSDGTVIAFGSGSNDDNGTDSGYTRVFKRQQPPHWNVWSQLGTDIVGERPQDMSGSSVSLSSDGYVLAIGSPYSSYDSSNTFGSRRGQVRVYHYVDGSWIQMGEDIDGDIQYSQFGESVQLSADGTILAIGAPDVKETIVNHSPTAGYVSIYKYLEKSWQKIGDNMVGKVSGDRYGAAISLSNDGNIIAIGSPSSDENGLNSGQVRVFEISHDQLVFLTQDGSIIGRVQSSQELADQTALIQSLIDRIEALEPEP